MNFHLLFIPFQETLHNEAFLAKTPPCDDSSFVTSDAESVEFSGPKKSRMQWKESHIRVLLRLYHEYRTIYPFRSKGLTDIGWDKLFLKMKEVFPQDLITLWGCRSACLRQLQKQEKAVSNIAQRLLRTNELSVQNEVGTNIQEVISDVSQISETEKKVDTIIDLYKEYFRIVDVIGNEENSLINEIPLEVNNIFNEEIDNDPLSYLTLLQDQTTDSVSFGDPTESLAPIAYDPGDVEYDIAPSPLLTHLEDQTTHSVSLGNPTENSLICSEAKETDKNKEKDHVSFEREFPKQSYTSPYDLEISSQDNSSTRKGHPVKHSRNFYIDSDKALSQRPTSSSTKAIMNSPSDYAHGTNNVENVAVSTLKPQPPFLMAKLNNFNHSRTASRIDHITPTSPRDPGMKEPTHSRQLTHKPNSRESHNRTCVHWDKHHLEVLKKLYDKRNESYGNTGYIREKDWQMIAVEMSTIFPLEVFTFKSVQRAYQNHATNL